MESILKKAEEASQPTQPTQPTQRTLSQHLRKISSHLRNFRKECLLVLVAILFFWFGWYLLLLVMVLILLFFLRKMEFLVVLGTALLISLIISQNFLLEREMTSTITSFQPIVPYQLDADFVPRPDSVAILEEFFSPAILQQEAVFLAIGPSSAGKSMLLREYCANKLHRCVYVDLEKLSINVLEKKLFFRPEMFLSQYLHIEPLPNVADQFVSVLNKAILKISTKEKPALVVFDNARSENPQDLFAKLVNLALHISCENPAAISLFVGSDQAMAETLRKLPQMSTRTLPITLPFPSKSEVQNYIDKNCRNTPVNISLFDHMGNLKKFGCNPSRAALHMNGLQSLLKTATLPYPSKHLLSDLLRFGPVPINSVIGDYSPLLALNFVRIDYPPFANGVIAFQTRFHEAAARALVDSEVFSVK